MNSKVLFITESYKINPSPNGNCVRTVAQELTARGKDVFVLSLKNQDVRCDGEYDSVKVQRVGTHLEWRVLFSKRIPRALKRGLSAFVSLAKKALIPWHPLRSPAVVSSLVKRGERIVKTEKIDVIVGVYRDFETAWAAVRLKKKSPETKLIIYTLDSIAGGVCSNSWVSHRTHVKKCKRWEMKMLAACDSFCAMQSHRAHLSGKEYDAYRGKIKYVDVPTLLLNDVDYTKSVSDGELNFAFTGMLSETNADCRFFLEVFAELCKRRDCRFDIYGGVSSVIMKSIEDTGLYGKNIFFHGRVESSALDDARRKADVLLNFGNEHPCGIPCKIFEYMATGKTILSFYKIDEDASRSYLERYPKALLLREKYAEAAAYADEILSFAKQCEAITVDRGDIEREFYANTPKELADFIEVI